MDHAKEIQYLLRRYDPGSRSLVMQPAFYWFTDRACLGIQDRRIIRSDSADCGHGVLLGCLRVEVVQEVNGMDSSMMNTLLSKTKGDHPVDMARDEEREFVDQLCKAVIGAGITSDSLDVIHFYITLKSKPLVILAGPNGIGKIALVEQLANVLKTGNRGAHMDISNVHLMLGHPWWAEKSDNLAVFTDAHMRFNTDKLLFVLNEAWRPENARRLFIVCLTRISPAELIDYFCELATQVSKGVVTHLGDHYFETPFPFPSNLRLIGTMDTLDYRWWDEELLSQAIVIPWIGCGKPINMSGERSSFSGESIILDSSVRDRQDIYQKIHSVLNGYRQPLLPLLEIESMLMHYGIQYHKSSFENAIAYIANSWSRNGMGIFTPSTLQNLAISLDMVISQVILPQFSTAIRYFSDLRKSLFATLTPQYPRSTGLVRLLAAEANG